MHNKKYVTLTKFFILLVQARLKKPCLALKAKGIGNEFDKISKHIPKVLCVSIIIRF